LKEDVILIKKFIAEFKEFAIKGNVIDLAVAVIIGNAINKIVTSLVSDIFMPILGIFIGHIDISSLSFAIKSRFTGANPIVIKYGDFLNTVINFLILTFCIFIMLKMMSKMRDFTFSKVSRNALPDEAEPEIVPPKTEDLLVEIRDLLREQTIQKTTSNSPEDLEHKH
jgi:large conductance mechanosensitive channel